MNLMTRRLLIPLICCALFSCGLFHTAKSDPVVAKGFVMVEAAGSITALGSNDSTLPPSERPLMFAKFSGNFQVARNEVTRHDFADLAGYIPEEVSADSENFPIRDVNWYEAIFYCNRLSEKLGMDSVYEWSNLVRSSDGRVQRLEGLSVHWDVAGVRLPTEAEYAYLTRNIHLSEWDHIAWFSDNSEGFPHSVASLAPVDGVYDLAGNVMEWMQDGLGRFSAGDTLLDYAGLAFGDQGQGNRIVKGGSYKHPSPWLDPLRREDIYHLNGEERLPYIGFRPVIGKITPSYTTSTGDRQSEVNLRLASTASSISSFLQAADFKLVFVETLGGRLCLLNGDGNFTVFPDTGKIYHPTVSPDGNWIAYSTRNEGQSGEGTIFVRRTDSKDTLRVAVTQGSIPRWWVDPVMNDTVIVYVNDAGPNDQQATVAPQTYAIPVQGGQPSGAARLISSQGAFHSGISQNGRYLASGYRNLLLLDQSSDSVKTLFQSPLNGKSALGSTQVCNVSLSQDSVPRILFLDFGSPDNSTIVGRPYLMHSRLFVMNVSGEVIHQYAPPSGFTSWDYPEWGSWGDVAVAVAQDEQERGRSIFGVNMSSGEMKELVTGDDFSYPWLWVRGGTAQESGLNDSLGLYGLPVGAWVKSFYAMRMLEFWSHQNSTFFIAGNSQAAMDFDPDVFSDPGYNMGIPVADIRTTYDIVMNYINVQAPRIPLRWVGIFVPMDNMWHDPSETSWTGEIETSVGRAYDSNHDFWKDGYPANFLPYLKSIDRPVLDLDVRPLGGVFVRPAQGWGVTPTNVWGDEKTRDSRYVAEPIRMIGSMVSELSKNGISTVLIIPPVHPWFFTDSRYGPTGMPDTLAQKIIFALDSICAQHTSSWLYDANNWGQHDYTDDEAADFQHLSGSGAIKLAGRVREFLIGKGVDTK